jgi:CBS domain-containing protein
MNKQRVSNVMTNLVVMIYPQDPIEEAASRLVRNGISGAPVVKDGKVVGVISEVDIARATIGRASSDRGLQKADVLSLIMRNVSASKESTCTVADVMSSQVFTIGPDENLFKAARLLDRHGLKRLSVVDGEGFLMGILARGDLIRAMTRSDAHLHRDVLEAIVILGEENFEDLCVGVDNGIVTLSGMTDRSSTRSIAVDIASRVLGVSEVVDCLDCALDDAQRRPAPNHSCLEGSGRDPWAALLKGA